MLVRKLDIDLVQSHLYRSNYVNVIASLLGSAHFMQLVNHGIASRYTHQGILGMVNLWLIRRLYPLADEIICPSQGMADDLLALGCEQHSIRIIHNPFDIAGIEHGANDKIPATLPFSQVPEEFIVSVGRLEKVKKFETGIKAFAQVAAEFPNLHYLILGDGPEKEELEKQIRSHGLEMRVHLTGNVENPFPFIKRAKLLLSTSEHEGFSNVIVEGLICRTPVIATDCPSGPREILAPGSSNRFFADGEYEKAEYGILVKVGDSEAIGRAISFVFSDNEFQKMAGKAGRIRVEDFDKRIIAEKCLKMRVVKEV